MKLDNYECDGQMSIFDLLDKPKVCSFSGHTCNKKNLWEVADTLDILQCPHVCCRKCNTRNCGARCNGSEEPKKVLSVDIRGICDDAYCPSCGYGFLDRETDMPECPVCKTKVNWDIWHKLNDEEETL